MGEGTPKFEASAAAQPASVSIWDQMPVASAPTVQGATIEAPPAQPAPVQSQPRYLNRELSQLDFDDRVLAMAEDESLPLLERVRFLAILGENVDQFFQVRVAGLKEQLIANLPQTSPDGMTTGEQLIEIHRRAATLLQRSTELFTDQIVPALDRHGVSLVTASSLSDADREYLAAEFRARIFPV